MGCCSLGDGEDHTGRDTGGGWELEVAPDNSQHGNRDLSSTTASD